MSNEDSLGNTINLNMQDHALNDKENEIETLSKNLCFPSDDFIKLVRRVVRDASTMRIIK